MHFTITKGHDMMSMGEAKEHIQQMAVTQLMASLVRQYGVDNLLKGLRTTYLDQVYRYAKEDEQVKHRVNLLNHAVKSLNHGGSTNG